MCTVTIILTPRDASADDGARTGGGADSRCVRLACNRDESRARPAALPPIVRSCGARHAIMPIDPVSGGTWIAVNDAGVAATLLNANPSNKDAVPVRDGALSRGVLVPLVMACATLDEAESAAAAIEPHEHSPFRLVIVDDGELLEFRSDGRSLNSERRALGDQPHLFTSSGLGDALVEVPRRALFTRMFACDQDWIAAQDAFHRHSWPDRRDVSVCMEREAARTVSHTVLCIAPDHVELTYSPEAPDRAVPLPPLSLSRAEICA